MNTLEERKKRVPLIIKKLKELFPTAKTALDYRNPWELLISVMLSAQTTDKAVNKATPALFAAYPTPHALAQAPIAEVERYIKTIGLYHSKAKNSIETAKIIDEKCGGEVPKDFDTLLTLPGVARKTANVVMGVAFGIPTGIAVDTHVRRLSQLLGLTESEDPKKIEKDLMEVVPQEEWIEFTLRMIDYGREYCPARTHDHSNCPLSNVIASERK
jgi:endonuclease-3